MSVPINSLVRVNWMGRCFGQRIVLTTGYKKTTGPTVLTDEQEMNGIIDDLIVGGAVDMLTDYLACLPPEYAMEEIRAQVVHFTRTTAVQRVIATPGTHASSATVASDSACITLKGAFAGANRRSNKHIGPVPDAASAAGLIIPAFVTKLNNLGNAMVTPVVLGGGETYIPTVWHIDPYFVATTHTLNQWTIGTTSRVQRRRTVGLGE